ncbi:MAG: hypothetical protein HY553_13230 [Elusimicrobia bacterium]|nr:hypothetical protein [Elusimicrobiota bacterium]
MDRKTQRELDRLLGDVKQKIAGLRLDVPELEALPPPPPPKPPEPPRPPVWIPSPKVMAAVTALTAAVAAYAFGVRPPAKISSTVLAMDRAVGLVRQGDRLLTLDPLRELLVSLGPDGEALGVSRLGERDAIDFVAADDGFWTSAAGGRIVLRGSEPGYPVKKAFANPGRSPQALAWDGILLWVSDPVAGSVYQYAPRAELAPIRELPLPGLSPVALHRDRGLLWILDGPTRSIRRYRVGPLPAPVDELALDPWLPPQARVAGMAVSDESLWILTQSPVTLHRFKLSRLPWRASAKAL